MCDYSDADIVVKRRITVVDAVDAKERYKKLVFKNKYWLDDAYQNQ